VEVQRLSELLQAEIDPEVFVSEHGIDTMMPFIAEYFPGAIVVAIGYAGEPPVNTQVIEKLWSVLRSELMKSRSGENFLLVSSDFSHHGNLVETEAKDLVTRRFLESPGRDTWIL